MSVVVDDMYGNRIEIGRAVADRAVSFTINEPKFANEVLIRMTPAQARDFAEKIKAEADNIDPV